MPTRYNYIECNDQYVEYRQARANRRSVHDRLGVRFPEPDRRLKIEDREGYQRKRIADQNWVNYEEYGEDEDYHEYVWQKANGVLQV